LYKVFWDRRDGDLESPPGFDPILAVLWNSGRHSNFHFKNWDDSE
jgi:hypothetical protein